MGLSGGERSLRKVLYFQFIALEWITPSKNNSKIAPVFCLSLFRFRKLSQASRKEIYPAKSTMWYPRVPHKVRFWYPMNVINRIGRAVSSCRYCSGTNPTYKTLPRAPAYASIPGTYKLPYKLQVNMHGQWITQLIRLTYYCWIPLWSQRYSCTRVWNSWMENTNEVGTTWFAYSPNSNYNTGIKWGSFPLCVSQGYILTPLLFLPQYSEGREHRKPSTIVYV